MSAKVFLDTNILIYSLDQFDPVKMQQARHLLKEINEKYTGVISTQVLQEFYVAATKKLHSDPVHTRNIMRQFEHFEIISINQEMIFEAIDCSVINQLSFWDALIIVAAEFAKCSELWTEDLSTGQTIRGVKIVNPFQ